MGIKSLLGHKTLLALVIAYTGLITWASLARFVINPLDFKVEGGDKIVHFIAYFVFTHVLFFFFFFSKKVSCSFLKALWRSVIICFLYGILMEFLQQALTDYRSMEWQDALANTSGIIFAALLLKTLENKLIRFRS